jgi:hemolysin activation/secretion protein
VALRADGRTARGDVPFYQLPFIDMRGVPAARYQDENVGVLEAEARYYVTPRWIALAFVGAGRNWGRTTSFEDKGTVVSKGVGFRYVLARRLGLAMGIDIAKGPEDTAFYIQMGNAWR